MDITHLTEEVTVIGKDADRIKEIYGTLKDEDVAGRIARMGGAQGGPTPPAGSVMSRAEILTLMEQLAS